MKVVSYVYNALNKVVGRKKVINVLKPLIYILIGFSAPKWYPLIVKITDADRLTGGEWLALVLLLVAPILVLWWCEKQDKKARVNELAQVMEQMFKKAGIIKGKEQ